MTYRHTLRRKAIRRFVAQKLFGYDYTRSPYAPPAFTSQRQANRDSAAAPHPLRTRRTVLGSLRSSNPTIRAAAKGLALRAGVLPGGLVHPLVAQVYAEQGYIEAQTDAWKGR